jgi:hypothetical protein
MSKPLSQKAGLKLFTMSDGTQIPLQIPNDVVDGDGFTISYNGRDRAIYGDVTTAIVTGNSEHFYVLNGNHMDAYMELIDDGLDACLDYFEANIDKISKYSEKPPGRAPSP